MNRVLYLLFLIFELLAEPVKALNAAGAGETAFFYYAYRTEWLFKDASHRRIAPKCSDGQDPCGYAKFVDHICTEEAQKANNRDQIKEILNRFETTDLVDMSKDLREANFVADYDQTRLLPKLQGNSVTEAIRQSGNIMNTAPKNKYREELRKMTDALDLVAEVRKADNMKYFITELEKQLGLKLETKPESTRDGIKYTGYDIEKTASNNQGVADLAKRFTSAVDTLRDAKDTNKFDEKFVIHQRIIRQAQKSADLLRAKAKC
ncbi:hypothetical protein IFM51744_06030 [Aspergillus udagawae]|nr:hypothetical protein IFM51744_06030 [Aspergillus udagawae]